MRTFLKTEIGAVTVDWVVLVAALVGLGLAVMAVVSGGIPEEPEPTESSFQGIGLSNQFAELAERHGVSAIIHGN